MKNSILSKYGFLGALALVAAPSYATQHAQGSLWHYPNVSPVPVHYNVDWAGAGYQLPGVTNYQWGRPILAMSDCYNKDDAEVNMYGDDYTIIQYPRRVHIVSGMYATISTWGSIETLTTPSRTTSMGHKSSMSSRNRYACGAVGAAWSGPYENGSDVGTTAFIYTPAGLPAGTYTLQIPVSTGLYTERFTDRNDKRTLSLAAMADYLQTYQTPVTLTLAVHNSCTMTPPSAVIDHGRQILGEADDAVAQTVITVKCTGAIDVNLAMTGFSSPTIQDPDGYRAGLGNGWDSVLTLNDQRRDIKLFFTSAGEQRVTVKSRLKRTGTSTEGQLQGSVVLVIRIA